MAGLNECGSEIRWIQDLLEELKDRQLSTDFFLGLMHDLTDMMVEGEAAEEDIDLPPIQPGQVLYTTFHNFQTILSLLPAFRIRIHYISDADPGPSRCIWNVDPDRFFTSETSFISAEPLQPPFINRKCIQGVVVLPSLIFNELKIFRTFCWGWICVRTPCSMIWRSSCGTWNGSWTRR